MGALKRSRTQGEAGFSLTEMIVVVGIIMIMAAVSMPQIARYIRNYRIRGASQAVASELSAARTKAIMKNVNLGVVFMIVNPTTYRYVIEDRQDAPAAREAVSAILADPTRVGPLRILPDRVQFGGCTGFVPTDRGVRFSRLGNWCNLEGAGPCPDIDTGQALVRSPVGSPNATICLFEIDTNLERLLTINAAGRVVDPQ